MRKKTLLLAGLIAMLAVVLGFVTFTPKQCITLVGDWGYWWMLASVGLFVAFLARSLRASTSPEREGIEFGKGIDFSAWRRWAWPLALVIGVTAVVSVQEPRGFKMVADEAVLQSTAMRLHFDRSATVVVRGYDIGGNYAALTSYIDKRPLLFPFLLATVHDLTGYRQANVYALNTAVTGLLFLMLFLIGRRIGGAGAGAASVLLLATLPLVAQNAAGGGFELLNMLMIAVTLWLGMRYAEKSSDTDRLAAFVLSSVLLAQARYESALFVLPVAGVLVYRWVRDREARLTWPVMLAPLLLLPVPWQHNVFKLSQATWQLDGVAGATTPFAWRYFYGNVGHAMNFFLTFNGTQPNSWLLEIAGCFAVGFFLLVLYKRHREIFAENPAEATLVIFIVSLLAHTVLMLCYFWGAWDDLIISRLSLPAHLLFVWALVYVWPRLTGTARRWRWLCGIAAVYCVGVTVPVASRHFYTNQNVAARSYNWVADQLDAFKGRHVLAIDSQCGIMWPLYRQSYVTPEVLADSPEKYLYQYENHSFNDYLVVQAFSVDLKTGSRTSRAGSDIGDAFKLKKIDECLLSPAYVVVLSRVVGVDKAKLDAWAKESHEHPKDKAVSTSSSQAAPPESSAKSVPSSQGEASEPGLEYWMKRLP